MMDLPVFFSLLNYAAVLFFGVTASLSLADIPVREHWPIYLKSYLAFGVVQILFYLLLGENALYKCYPLLIHLPLVLLIHFMLKKNIFMSLIAVLSAYSLCTPRKWIGTLVSSFWNYDPTIANVVSTIATFPLLFLVVRYMTPHIVKLKQENQTTLTLLLLLPLSYYILEYSLTVYTDLLYSGGAVAIDFMDSFLVLLYFLLSILSIETSSKRNQAEQENLILVTAAVQAQKEITQLSLADKQSAIYRHDLRHHLSFLQECIRENQLEQAMQYMNEICSGLDKIPVKRYCENQPLNLILSSYLQKANDQNIQTVVSVTAGDFEKFQITDLCSLLANALENAIHACATISNPNDRYIHLKIYNKNGLLCVNMANSYAKEPFFRNDLPVSLKNGHGIGVQSMISVIEKYHGLYRFFVSDGEFHFQASL